MVSYCTGGIRCEKAALLMAEAGIENVLQLDGGILQLLRAHRRQAFRRRLFRLRRREALDVALTPT